MNPMLERIPAGEGERDTLVLVDAFLAAYDEQVRSIVSPPIENGIPKGMLVTTSRLVAPSACGVRLMLDNQIDLTGAHVLLPARSDAPVPDELERPAVASEG